MTDWQVGDLAVCVDDAERPTSIPSDLAKIKRGNVYRVARILCGGLGLQFEEAVTRHSAGYWEDRFRKIRPDEHQACEPEFVTLLKRAKRPVAA
jgi:hypothetical protein